MTTLPDAVRQSELLSQVVLNRSTMEELGRIEVLWMYPQAHRVLGFVCKTGFFGGKKLAFKLSQVDTIGGNGVLTHSQPDETDAERVRQLESLIQTEVWSDAGYKLGKIVDCVFNLRTGVITDYLAVGDRLSTLTGSIYRLPPSKILRLGRQRVIIAEASLQDLPAYREGLQQKIAKVSTSLKEEYEDVTYELRSLAQRAQETTQEKTERIKSLAEQARERAQLLAEQAKERAKELNEQWLESAQTFAEKARETSETLVERVQDTTQEWGEQIKEIQTVTVPAHEVSDFDELEDDDLDWDDFDFDEDEPASPKTASPQPATRTYPTMRSPQPTPPPIKPPPPPAEDDPEDFWVIGDDLTLQRRKPSAHDQIPFTMEEGWDMDDDPWDITEPPTTETPIILAIVNEPFVNDQLRDEPLEEISESIVDAVPHTRTDSTDHPQDLSKEEDEEEPWV